MRKIYVLSLFICLVLGCAACNNTDSSSDESNSSPTPQSTTAPATTLSPVLVDLQHDYEQISESQAAILKIWDDLAANKQVQCGDYPTILSPEAISAEEDSAYTMLADLLRSAAIDTAHAIDLWRAECLNSRAIIPPDVIDEGRLITRSAGDALRKAQPQLGDIQGE